MTTTPPDPDEVQFEIRGFGPSDDRAEKVRADIEAAGGAAEVTAQEGDRALALIPIIMGAMALVALIGAIKNLLDDFHKGVIIDTRGEKVITTIDDDLPRGTVVIIAADNTKVTLEQPDSTTLEDAIKAARGALSGS